LVIAQIFFRCGIGLAGKPDDQARLDGNPATEEPF
jgi:hypothetical protein